MCLDPGQVMPYMRNSWHNRHWPTEVGKSASSLVLVKNPPPAPGSLFLGVAIRSASGRDLTRVPKQISISGKPTSRLATRHF